MRHRPIHRLRPLRCGLRRSRPRFPVSRTPVAIDGRGTGPSFGLPPGVLYGVPGHGFRREPARLESEPGGLFLPALAQLVAVDVALGRAGHQRRALGEALVVRGGAATALGHRRLDLGAPGRERLYHLAWDARDLEPPVGMGLLDAVAEPVKARSFFSYAA